MRTLTMNIICIDHIDVIIVGHSMLLNVIVSIILIFCCLESVILNTWLLHAVVFYICLFIILIILGLFSYLSFS